MSITFLQEPNAYKEIADVWWIGETITLDTTTKVYYFYFEAWWGLYRKDIYCEVYLTDEAHHPVGDPIATAKDRLNAWEKHQVRKRGRFYFWGLIFEAGVEYFILIRDEEPTWHINSRIYIREGDSIYEGGMLYYSENSGETWTEFPNDDIVFALTGTPEVPPPPPPAPIKNFSILDLVQTPTATGLKIVATTNVPCHMYCYWTAHEPQKHLIPILTRGIELHTQLKMCFVDWTENEQEEPLDTLIHTFIKEPWAVCETRWMTFRATVMGDWIPPFTEKMPPPKQWARFHEPWGTTLTEYNYWTKYLAPEVPTVTFEDGICKLTNPGYSDCGISVGAPATFPLVQPENGDPLLISFNNTDVTQESSSSQVLMEFILRKDGEFFAIYLAIGLGAEFEDQKPQWTGYIAGRYYGVFYTGPGEFTKDLYALFVKFRTELGQSTDPTGWELCTLAFALGTQSPACTDYIKSDYLTIYYTDPVMPWSPSVGPIFKKHRVEPEIEPVTTEFVAVKETGYLYWRASAWAATWGNATGLPMEGIGYYEVITRTSSPHFTVGRGILRFDTSDIPDDATIVSAKLKIAWFRNVYPTHVGEICFVPAVGCGNEMNVADYAALRENIISICGSIPVPPLVLDTYYEKDLYPAGLAHISKTGQTRFGIRCLKDLENTQPSSANRIWASWYGEEDVMGIGVKAKLIVTYQ